MMNDIERIRDLVYTARRAAQSYHSLSHVDDSEPAEQAHRAFNSLADAIAALLRLVEARAEDAAEPLAADRRDPASEDAAAEARAARLAEEAEAGRAQALKREGTLADEPQTPALPVAVQYTMQELVTLKALASEFLDVFEKLRAPDEADEADVLAVLSEYMAMAGRGHYLAKEILRLPLVTDADDDQDDDQDNDDQDNVTQTGAP